MESLTLKRHNSFQNRNTHSFARKPLIFTLMEIQRYLRELELSKNWPRNESKFWVKSHDFTSFFVNSCTKTSKWEKDSDLEKIEKIFSLLNERYVTHNLLMVLQSNIPHMESAKKYSYDKVICIKMLILPYKRKGQHQSLLTLKDIFLGVRLNWITLFQVSFKIC